MMRDKLSKESNGALAMNIFNIQGGTPPPGLIFRKYSTWI